MLSACEMISVPACTRVVRDCCVCDPKALGVGALRRWAWHFAVPIDIDKELMVLDACAVWMLVRGV